MLGLTLSIGLIDDAIIVIENIYRHVEGMKPREPPHSPRPDRPCRHGDDRSHRGDIPSRGLRRRIIGRFFQFALTVFAVLVSLIVSFTLTPAMSSRFI